MKRMIQVPKTLLHRCVHYCIVSVRSSSPLGGATLYSGPRVADQSLDRHEGLVSYIWILVSHKFHHSRLRTEVGDNSATSVSGQCQDPLTMCTMDTHFFPRS